MAAVSRRVTWLGNQLGKMCTILGLAILGRSVSEINDAFFVFRLIKYKSVVQYNCSNKKVIKGPDSLDDWSGIGDIVWIAKNQVRGEAA